MLLFTQAKRAVREFGRDRLNGVYYRFPIFRYVYFGFIVYVRRRHVHSPTRRLHYIIIYFRIPERIVISFLLFFAKTFQHEKP